MTAIVVPTSSGRPSGPDLWEQALLELKAKNELSFDIERLDRRVVLEEVLSEVLKREQLAQQKRWKWKNRKGETIIVRDVFAKMVKWINKFKQIGDTVIQYDPVHAALPWAAIRFVLQVVASEDQVQCSMAEGLELVLMLIARYEIVEIILLRGSSEAQTQLSESIVKLYAAIMSYLSELHRYYTRSTPEKLASAIRSGESASQKWIDKIKNAENQVHVYSQLVSYETTRSTGHDVSFIHTSVQQLGMGVKGLGTSLQDMKAQVLGLDQGLERLQTILSDLDKPIFRMASALSAIKDNLNETERLRIFEWLTNVRYTRHQKEKAKSLLKGSGQWLLNRLEFLDWMASSTSSILWLHGIPGSGKSMLVATVIEYLRSKNDEVEHPAPIGFFYCARNTDEPERADPEVILRTILEQLSSTNQHCPIRKPVCQKYMLAKDESRGRPPDKLTLEETVDLILDLLKDNPATIILDGLDECDPQKRQGLLNGLQKILKQSDNIVKIFVSSRDDHDLVHRLAETPNLYIHAADNRQDIESFVHSRVSEAIKDERILCGRVPEKLIRVITDTLIQRAEGMFRLVSLHIETLCDPQQIKTEESVRTALRRLPKDLSKSYGIILEQIRNSEEPNPKIAENTMRWLLCARWTLPSRTFIRAVCAGNVVLNRSEILSICANLVIYDAESDIFRFAHLSVQEYLESLGDYHVHYNNARIAGQCIFHLIASKSEVNLAFYCITNWTVHVGKAAERIKEETVRKSLYKILSCFSTLPSWYLYTTWYKRRGGFVENFNDWISSQRAVLLEGQHCESNSTNVLLVACVYGLSEIVEEILSNLEAATSNLQAHSSQGFNCAELAVLFNQVHLIPIMFAASQNAGLSDEYWHRLIRTICSLEKALMHPNGRCQTLETIIGYFRYDFLTEEELAMILWIFHWHLDEPHYWSLFSKLLGCCSESKVLSAIMKINGIYGQDSWFNSGQSHHNNDDFSAIRDNISKVERLHQSLHPPSPPSELRGPGLIRILSQLPENVRLPTNANILKTFLRIIMYSWNTTTTQMILAQKQHIPAINDIVKEMLCYRNEDVRILLWETIIKRLDPQVEHTFLVLSLGNVEKVGELLKKVPIAITTWVVETVAMNWRYGEDVMKLLLAREPEVGI